MKIANLHYHLRTGGVTTVIRQQAAAVKSHCQLLLMSGEPSKEQFDAPFACIPGLAYDRFLSADTTPEKTADDVMQAMMKAFGCVADLLHVHNPLISKNRYLLKVLQQLQERGVRLLLQIHDFAEDGRPHVYYRGDEYPENCHYAVINSRDYHMLRKAGLDPKGLHMLENVVNPLPVHGLNILQENAVLYPVRAIRRKNIGEAILLNQFFKDDDALLITQPPNSREDQLSYQDWQAFVSHHNLNVKFEAGVERIFSELVAGARFLVTTSISEGFGFSFLEPWTAEKFLHGRLLPEICEDFSHNDVNLSHLYPALLIPVKWIDLERFKNTWSGCMHLAMEKFGMPDDFMDANASLKSLIHNDNIDFGILDETFQRQVIGLINADNGKKDELRQLNPFLDRFYSMIKRERISSNHNAVNRHYHPDSYTSKLLNIYKRVLNEQVSHKIDKTALLKQFLKPQNLSLLKWRRYEA